MQNPILNSHNKAEYEPAENGHGHIPCVSFFSPALRCYQMDYPESDFKIILSGDNSRVCRMSGRWGGLSDRCPRA